jgi:kynurenine formamidase
MENAMKWQDVRVVNSSLLDVSLPVRPGMFPISEDSDVQLRVLSGYDSPTGLLESQLRMSCHAGTHIDYPSHLDPTGHRAFDKDAFNDAFFPEHYFTLAYFLPFDSKRSTEPLPEGRWEWGDEIERAEVEAWFARFDADHPSFPHEQVQGAVFRTGWNDHWFEPDFWRRGGPTLSDGAAHYLMARGLHYIASDFTFTFEPGRTHDIVLRHPDRNRFQVESLCNLGAIDGDLIGLLVAPLKLEGREGLPARVFAVPVLI